MSAVVNEASDVPVSEAPDESDESIEIKESEEAGEMPTADTTLTLPIEEWEEEWGDFGLFNHFSACCVSNGSIQEPLIPFLGP